MITHWS